MKNTTTSEKKKENHIAIGVLGDALAGWLGSCEGADSPGGISRGMFAGEVGALRLLRLFDQRDIRASWFIPGHSIETLSRAAAAGGGCAARDRHPRLPHAELDLPVACKEVMA